MQVFWYYYIVSYSKNYKKILKVITLNMDIYHNKINSKAVKTKLN